MGRKWLGAITLGSLLVLALVGVGRGVFLSAHAGEHEGGAPAAPAAANLSLENLDDLPRAPMSAPPNVPAPITRKQPATLLADIVVEEKEMKLADGTSYKFWTYNGTVPGPMIRVREGDTLVVRYTNPKGSTLTHSIDLHAVTGTGGGSVLTQTAPGKVTAFTFKALKPGLYVYHCATPSIPMHIANGMYGMILVEPAEGLPPVDREYYVMQQEVYTNEDWGEPGLATFSYQKMRNEQPEYVVLNGAVGSLLGDNALPVEAGQTVRIYFGVGGPNLTSSFHVIGEIFDRVYEWGSFSNPPLEDVQTVSVPPGGAAAVDVQFEVPGTYHMVDHALSRLEKGAVGDLKVSGAERPDIYSAVK